MKPLSPLLAAAVFLLAVDGGVRVPVAKAEGGQDYEAAKRGAADAKAGKYDAAIKDFDEAIHLDPDNAENYRNRGIVYNRKGDPAHAIESFTEALEALVG